MRLVRILTITLLLAGCSQPLEMTARDLIAANKGVLTSAQAQYKATCTANPAQGTCNLINRDVFAQNVAIDALELYCAGVDFSNGGACKPDKAYAPKLQEALLNLNRNLNDVKGLVK